MTQLSYFRENNKLARSIKFTVGPSGKIDNGIASANKLSTGRVIVPVAIIGDQDGQWDRGGVEDRGVLRQPSEGLHRVINQRGTP